MLLALFFFIVSILWWRIGTAVISVTNMTATSLPISSSANVTALMGTTDFVAVPLFFRLRPHRETQGLTRRS